MTAADGLVGLRALPLPDYGRVVGAHEEPLHELAADELGDHMDRLYRAAWALCGSREDAEDLVQDTYTRVLARPRFLRRDHDLGYLLRVLRNTFVSDRRRAGRRPDAVPFDDAAPEPTDERSAWRPPEAFDATAMFAVIAGLPDVYRDALVAVDVAGLSYAEAGHVIGAREATVASRLHRARERVAAELRSAPAERTP